MKQFESNGKKYAAVPMPLSADRFKVFNDEQPYVSYFYGVDTPRIYLPSGQWQILGLCPELSEVDCAGIVPPSHCTVFHGCDLYQNYSRDENLAITSAIESLHTLIASLGLDWQRTLILEMK